jgi:hypothetical protein
MTEPVDDIFPRDDKQPEVDELLLQFSKGIDEVVNYGTHILKWEVSEGTSGDENVPIAMMLRHILELTDSISILVRNASIDPCKLILRGILETVFGLEYILESDTENRALGFIVWHFNKQLKFYKKINPGEQAFNQFEKKLQMDKSTLNGIKLPVIPDIQKRIQELEQILSTRYATTQTEYQKLISSGIKNPSWYQLFNGPKSMEQLATYLNRQALYEVLYRDWSGPTHGTDIIQNKLFKSTDGDAQMVQIRYVKDAQVVTQHVFNLSLIAYQIMTNKRITGHKLDLSQWYLTIRDFFMRLTNEKLINV